MKAGSKPWLKTWGTNGFADDPLTEPNGIWVAEFADDDDQVLASAAPEMCRALLVVEYATHRQGGAECPICAEPPGHHHACLIDAALTKAGLPDHESRNAARKEMGL